MSRKIVFVVANQSGLHATLRLKSWALVGSGGVVMRALPVIILSFGV